MVNEKDHSEGNNIPGIGRCTKGVAEEETGRGIEM